MYEDSRNFHLPKINFKHSLFSHEKTHPEEFTQSKLTQGIFVQDFILILIHFLISGIS